MKKYFSENIIAQFVFLSLVVFLSRLPFLWAGFGAEEDSWLVPLTAKHIALTGTYQMSRAPGHPLQELIYSLMWNAGPFAYNLFTAITSVIAVLFFTLALRNLGFKHYLFAAFAFAFTPIVFISSTYAIDYMPAMAFVMGSFYAASPPAPLQEERGGTRWVIAGILLGIAIGFRLTSAAMLIPFCIWKFPPSKKGLRGVFLFVITTVLVGTLTYIPVLKTYGLTFFTYSDQFPYPNVPKVIYKATVGVFGMIGIGTLIFFKIKVLAKKVSLKENLLASAMPSKLFWASISVVVIYIISYLRLPQKSAYLMPIIPFSILLVGYFTSERAFKTFCVLMTMSSFLFSINLNDSLRGSKHSPLAMQFTMAGQEIFMDPLTGPLFSDYTKRLNKMEFTEEVYQKTNKEKRKIVLICGWWFNELKVRNWDTVQNPNVQLVFYTDKSEMEKYISEGNEIYYLPEQDLYNDQFSQMNCTNTLAKPYAPDFKSL
jgi:hypothetical protein